MPRLIVHEPGGPRAVALGRAPAIVGRSEDCAVRLGVADVSRHHCRVLPAGGGGYEVEDLGSQNGTKVNGERIAKRRLRDGDRIELGTVVLVFAEGADAPAVPLDVTMALARSIYGEATGLPEAWRREREQLLRLADVMLALATEDDPDALLDRIMGAAVALSGAERGFLILFEGEKLAVKAARNLARDAIEGSAFAPSRSVVQQVARTGRAVLLSDAGTAAGFEDAQSIVDLGLRSVLAVPLAVPGRVLGALYLDDSRRAGVFGAAEERLLRLFGSQAAVAVERTQHRTAERARQAMAHEVALASRIQRRLLPTAAPVLKRATLHGVTVPATAVTGDYFDYLPAADGRTTDIIVADVAGKGLPAGLVMVMARGVLRSVTPRCGGPLEVLTELHRLLKPDLDARIFCAATAARWDDARGELRVAGAGLGPLLLYRAAGKRVEELATGGMVVGAPVASIEDRLTEQVVPLARGDVALWFTDGATEARDGAGTEFGRARLGAAFRRHGAAGPTAVVEGVLAEVQAFVGDQPAHDDLTLVALRRD